MIIETDGLAKKLLDFSIVELFNKNFNLFIEFNI